MKRKGSAILTVIGSITVLVIIAFAYISSSREKKGISKLMSDEKKVEALAESANDYIIKFIKKNANIHEDTSEPNSKYLDSIYYLLRAPLKAPNRDGDNFKLDVSNAKPIEKIEDIFDYKTIIDSTIKNIGWEGKVDITSSCELVEAEYFTPHNLDYRVTTIDYEHLPAVGNSAKFLDDDDGYNNSSENYSEDWAPSQWKLTLKFPKGDPYYEEKEITIDVHGKILSWDEDITLKIRKNPQNDEDSTDLKIQADDITFVGHKDFDINIQEKMDEANFFPNISPKTLQGLKKAYTSGNINYDFSDYVNKISNRKKVVNDNYKKVLENFDISSTDLSDNYFVEKGAILRIKTVVKYKKQDNQDLEKVLISEIPFKASDAQPMAPEYSFFIANSTKVSSQDEISGHVLGEPIQINKSDSSVTYNSTPPGGNFIVHNLPIKNNKVDYDAVNDGVHVPGMVRINTNYTPGNNQVTKVKTFLGIKSEPETTELNKFFTPFNNSSNNYSANKYNTRVSFAWDDTPWQRYHEIEFPLLFENAKTDYLGPGIDKVVEVFKQSGYAYVSVPTLLFGICHMEYPLGLRAEGPIDSVYSRLRIQVDVDGESDFYDGYTDHTMIHFNYEPLSTYSNGSKYDFDGTADEKNSTAHATYGMQKYLGYNPNDSWDSNGDFKYSPANCYDALQYAKKATRYYDEASDFLADLKKDIAKGGLKDTDGTIKLNGVYYIKDEKNNLVISTPIKYKGNGLIVDKKKNIFINSNITRDDSDKTSTLGIIARSGYIKFNTDKVMAACFSNNTPTCTVSNLNLYGNLVCNNFLRDKFTDANIFYDNTICNVTPFASLRKTGKFEPKRYAVTFADNWSRFTFEKPKETTN